MNILFFLTHKANCTYIYDDFTIRQALERMEHGGRFATIPILKRTGEYVGTISEGDLLWGLKNKTDLVQKGLEKVRITEIPRRSDNQPVLVNADMEDLLGKIMNQNFVPVLDDQKNFIGIITRKDVISYLCKK